MTFHKTTKEGNPLKGIYHLVIVLISHQLFQSIPITLQDLYKLGQTPQQALTPSASDAVCVCYQQSVAILQRCLNSTTQTCDLAGLEGTK